MYSPVSNNTSHAVSQNDVSVPVNTLLQSQVNQAALSVISEPQSTSKVIRTSGQLQAEPNIGRELEEWFLKEYVAFVNANQKVALKRFHDMPFFLENRRVHEAKALQAQDPVDIYNQLLLANKIDKRFPEKDHRIHAHLLRQLRDYRMDTDILFSFVMLLYPHESITKECCKLLIKTEHQHFVHFLNAFLYYSEKNFIGMIKELIIANQLNPKEQLYPVGLILAYYKLGDYSQTTNECFELLKLNDSLDIPKILICFLFYEKSKFQVVEDLISKENVSTQSSEYSLFRKYLLVNLLILKQKHPEALSSIEKYLNEEPENPVLLALKATVLLSNHTQGSSVEEARSLMNKAMTIYQKTTYPSYLRYEFAMMNMHYHLFFEEVEEAKRIATHAKNFGFPSERADIPNLTEISNLLEQPALTPKEKRDIANRVSLYLSLDFRYINAIVLEKFSRIVVRLHHFKMRTLTGKEMMEIAKLRSDDFKTPSLFLSRMSIEGCQIQNAPHFGVELNSFKKQLQISSQREHFTKHLECIEIHDSPQEALVLYGSWVYSNRHIRLVFSDFADYALSKGLMKEGLAILEKLREQCPSNSDLLYAIATLNWYLADKELRQVAGDQCKVLMTTYQPAISLWALKQCDDKDPEAIKSFEHGFMLEYNRTRDGSYFKNMKLSHRAAIESAMYIKQLIETYNESKAKVCHHVQQLLKQFVQQSPWTFAFKKTINRHLEDALDMNKQKRKEVKPAVDEKLELELEKSRQKFRLEQEKIMQRLAQEREELLKKEKESAVNHSVVILPAQKSARRQPDQDELDNKQKITLRKMEAKTELQAMLAGGPALPKHTKFSLESLTPQICKEFSKVFNHHSVDMPAPEAAQKPKPIEFAKNTPELVIATAVLRKPAFAERVYFDDQKVIPKLSSKEEVLRLKQACEQIMAMESLLAQIEKREYDLTNPRHSFIATRAMMYHLLRLGECLFPTSSKVRNKLSSIYTETMEKKVVDPVVMKEIRKNTRYDFIAVTHESVINVCKTLVSTNLHKNLLKWYNYSSSNKEAKEEFLIKTVLPKSCSVIGGVGLEGKDFLANEVGHLAMMHGKMEDVHFFTVPDVIKAIKMSICILAKLDDQFKDCGLTRFKPYAAKIAHDFGEDYEGDYDDISEFDAKEASKKAVIIHEVFFKKHVIKT